MQIPGTVSSGSEGNIFIELFHFRALLLVSDSRISKSLDRFLQRWKVKGPLKTQITLSVTFTFTMATEQIPKGEEVARDGMGRMAAEWHRVGLERPHFCTRFRAQSESPVDPAQQEHSVGARGEVKKVGITSFSFVFTIFFSLGCA